MEYKTITITVPIEDESTQTVQAQEAVGTGLAYHPSSPFNLHPYVITSLNCHNIPIGCSCRTERVAQIYLEEIAGQTEWNANQKTIWADLRAKFGDLHGIRVANWEAYKKAEKVYRAEQGEHEVPA